MGHFNITVQAYRVNEGKSSPLYFPQINNFLLTIGSPLHMRSHCNHKSQAIIHIRLLYSSELTVHFNYTAGQARNVALNTNVKFTRHFQTKMFERVEWISRTSVRTSMTPRNHQGTYPEKFTNVRERSHTTAPCKSQQYYHCINVENTIDTRHRYRQYLLSSNPHTHKQTTFRSV